MNNKEIVLRALDELLNKRDPAAVERYWGDPYIQHSPEGLNGRENLSRLIATLPPDLSYEVGLVAAEDDLVMVQGRYRGVGEKPIIAVDILRLEHGKIVEHWDVMQEEITETASGNPMFTPRGE